jgi:hypothetical protein
MLAAVGAAVRAVVPRPFLRGQIALAEGTGLMNGVERLAAAVWERHCPDQDQPPVWVERQL